MLLIWHEHQSVFPKFQMAKLLYGPILFLKLGIKTLSLFFLGCSFFLSCGFLFCSGFLLRTFLFKQIFCFFHSYFIGLSAFWQFHFCFSFYKIETPPTCFLDANFLFGPFVD